MQHHTPFEFHPTRDIAVIKSVITHPAIYPFIMSDGRIKPEHWEPCMSEHIMYLLVKKSGALLGMFLLVETNLIRYEIHTCFFPWSRGKVAFEAHKEGLKWAKYNTPCRKVIGRIPSDNKASLTIALRSGMTIIGIDKNCAMRDGQLLDETIVGMEL